MAGLVFYAVLKHTSISSKNDMKVWLSIKWRGKWDIFTWVFV